MLRNDSPGLRRAWHPVLQSAELGDGPARVELLGEAYVVCRIDGEIVAFADRCPHRNARLSDGTIVDNHLQCPYHGWEFDGTGTCAFIPALGADATVPPTSRLAPARVQVAYGLVWIAPDEPVCGILHIAEFNDPSLQAYSETYQQQNFGRQLFQTGTLVPFGLNYVQETTVFREFGPLSGNTVRVAYEVAPKIGDTLSRQTADVDARYYQRIGTSGLLALRARSFKSWGDSPTFMYFGGNSELRGYDYLSFLGSKATFLNAELRFPFIEAMLTPVGVLGGIRGVFFVNMGGGSFEGQTGAEGGKFKWFSSKDVS